MIRIAVLLAILLLPFSSYNQDTNAALTLERIFQSSEFRQERMPSYQWRSGGEEYLSEEFNDQLEASEIVQYNTLTGERNLYLSAAQLTPAGASAPLSIESFYLSEDQSKVLIFNNSQRVWRSNTKGDYWVYDKTNNTLRQLGKTLPASSLMFAKFKPDNTEVAYVSNFNLYKENFKTGEITQLTFDGTGDIINGTFDWVYEEEFGCRDGFRWSPDGRYISIWQLDASEIGTFYMINNTDSIYSKMIPLQYPKVGQNPASCRVALIDNTTGNRKWIAIPGDPIQHYIPRMQWVKPELLLIQQINRKQNRLIYWNYNPKTDELKKVYEETEDTWVDIDYPDVSSSTWGMYDLSIIDGNSVTRMTENDGWRHVYKINLENGSKKLLTPDDYDVASTYANDGKYLYYSASPTNSTQRYLYRVALDGSGSTKRLTPESFSGINKYDISPNGKYAFHTHSNVNTPSTTRLIRTSDHGTLREYVTNEAFTEKMKTISTGEIRFFSVNTAEDINIDGRMILPPNFDSTQQYPVLFHVYGEPWGQVAQDSWVGMWERYITQQGYIIIDMDNRGTPCLKGSEWRKSIYRKIGVLNSSDQAAAAREVLTWNFIDPSRTAVWGWSGGGSMTLNMMFRYPDIYTTGISVAPVGNQLFYDNIYQERYMGLPQENLEDFVEGSPVTYAKNLKGNLMLIHGTGDDNVHYQNAEIVINELIKNNIPFDMMSYPNRSHGIYEGKNTSAHLYSLITRYLTEHVEAGPKDVTSIRP